MRKYTYVTRENDTWANICILESNYRGIIYNYGKVSIPDESLVDDQGRLPLRFEYNIIESKEKPEDELRNDPAFKNLLGDILVEILDEQLEADNLTYRKSGDGIE